MARRSTAFRHVSATPARTPAAIRPTASASAARASAMNAASSAAPASAFVSADWERASDMSSLPSSPAMARTGTFRGPGAVRACSGGRGPDGHVPGAGGRTGMFRGPGAGEEATFYRCRPHRARIHQCLPASPRPPPLPICYVPPCLRAALTGAVWWSKAARAEDGRARASSSLRLSLSLSLPLVPPSLSSPFA